MIKKIAFLSNHISGYVKLSELLKNNIKPNLITIKKKNNISGQISFEKIINKKKIYKAKSFKLDSLEDIAYLKKMKFDILLISGWQRIIPNNVLKLFKYGAIAEHGSYDYLPFGKGRSPAGWTLRKGKKFFILHIFKATRAVDEGNIIDYKIIKINEYDNITTLYYKIGIVSANLTIKNLKSLTKQKYDKKVPLRKEFFFRKIHYKDDYINWKNTTFKIYNLIRACRKPYPMAKSKLGNKIFYINEAYPFDNFIDKKIKVGTITNIFPDQSLLVKTMDGRILIKEYLCEKKIREGLILK